MLDLKKLHNDIDAVYCCCEDCRKRARRTKPENLPLLGTVMNTEYAMYNYNYDVSHENYDQFLSSLRDILVKHPKLTIPVLAALSELFLPKEHMAVYHFPTASVPAKKLINLIVSLFYDRVYEYTPELMEYRIPDTGYRSIPYDSPHVMHLDTWDFSKFFPFDFYKTILPLNDIGPECSGLLSHVLITTYDHPFTMMQNGGRVPYYKDILYVNTTYGNDSDLQEEYEKLLKEALENGYGHMINTSVAVQLKKAGKMPEIQNDWLKELLEFYAGPQGAKDPMFSFYKAAYIEPLFHAASAANEVLGLEIDMEALEVFIARCIYSRGCSLLGHRTCFAHFQNYLINSDFSSHSDMISLGYERPDASVSVWKTHEFILTEDALRNHVKKAFTPIFGKNKMKEKYKSMFESWMDLDLLTEDTANDTTIYTIQVIDYDPTAGLF